MKTVASLLMLAVAVQGFALVAQRPSAMTKTSLQMGLFDFLQPPKPSSTPNSGDDVFAGRGKRITIREDEDNAMVRYYLQMFLTLLLPW